VFLRLLYAAVVIVALMTVYQVWAVGRTMQTLATAPLGIAAGPEDARVTVVEFLDYRCPACRGIHPVMKELQSRHPEVRFIFRVIPVLGDESVPAARLALAAGKQGKFQQAHELMIERDGPVADKDIPEIAVTLGLDAETLRRDMTSSDVLRIIKRSISAARRMGVRGTPGFVINGVYYRSKYIPSLEDIDAAIVAEAARVR
jgi:protein-disulfide isomerase